MFRVGCRDARGGGLGTVAAVCGIRRLRAGGGVLLGGGGALGTGTYIATQNRCSVRGLYVSGAAYFTLVIDVPLYLRIMATWITMLLGRLPISGYG